VAKRRCAVFTLQRNEHFHLPLWIRYYGQHFDRQDMYVLDHDSDEASTLLTLMDFQDAGGNVHTRHHELTFDHAWLLDTVHAFQRLLLAEYRYVLFTDCDEWVVPSEGGLREFIEDAAEPAYRCTGYEVIVDNQYRWQLYDKTLLSRVPLTWIPGYHFSKPEFPVNGDLLLYHLHRLDFAAAWDKLKRWRVTKVDPVAMASGLAWQNFDLPDKEAFKRWFWNVGPSREAIEMGEAEPWDQRLVYEMDFVK